MSQSSEYPFINREISWLSFNERVLQEAADPAVPLIERLRFLGIFSNNRDEFFRVRVATLKRIAGLKKKDKVLYRGDPLEILDEIHKITVRQEASFEKLYNQIFKVLEKENIFIVDDQELTSDQEQYLIDYFDNEVRPTLVPIMLDKNTKFPYLRDRMNYFAIRINDYQGENNYQFALMEIPTDILPRFIELPSDGPEKFIIMLDDVIRFALEELFKFFDFSSIEAYTIKLTRDAELDIDDDISKSLIDKISKSIKNRKVGEPVRFVYDSQMNDELLQFILKKLDLKRGATLIPGGKYHNFRDFINFPKIGNKRLYYQSLEPLPHPHLTGAKSYLAVVEETDILLYYPFQSFNYFINILREAAMDPDVTEIKINLYRVANQSKVINALVNAIKNGKEVTVVVELTARFDEQANIELSNKLQDEGAKVIFGVSGLKVHSKLALINRVTKEGVKRYAHIGTGNFHEGTAKVYTDASLITSHEEITKEVEDVFDFFENNYKVKEFNHLLVSPYTTRNKFINLINKEIKNAKKGKEAYIILKLNNLMDEELNAKLYQASGVGVKIKLIVRGICSLVPGVKGLSENIEAISIVDRFLEHSRIMVFCNSGKPLYFISSADWMLRNLDKRVEVTTPIYDKGIQKILQDVLDIQLDDNVKSRILGNGHNNDYKKPDPKEPQVRSQVKTYQYFLNLLNE